MFDLVISDIGLPDGTGLQLMSALKAKYNLRVRSQASSPEGCMLTKLIAMRVISGYCPLGLRHGRGRETKPRGRLRAPLDETCALFGPFLGHPRPLQPSAVTKGRG